MLLRSEAKAYRAQAFMLACQIGLSPAAKALGLKPERLRQWNKRYKWNVGAIRQEPSTAVANDADLSLARHDPIKALASVLALEGDRTRLAMARTSRRAFEHSDSVTDEQLHELPRAVALEKHGRVAAIAHNWGSAQANVAVQVNVPLPSAEERKEMRSIDEKLDQIAAKLR